MSDLVERVVKEIAICRKSGGIKCEQVCDYCKDDAVRAIKAVAEWLEKSGSMQAAIVGNALLEQLEGSE